MSAIRVRDMSVGQMHEFAICLDKAGFDAEFVQNIIGAQGNSMAKAMLLAVIGEVMADPELTITRDVIVDRSLTAEQAITATGRRQTVDPDVLATMPQGKGEKIEIVFFREKFTLLREELKARAARRGLVLLDPFALSAFNAQHPEFADEHPNVTQWVDASGNLCCVYFDLFDSRREVNVDRRSNWVTKVWVAARKLAP